MFRRPGQRDSIRRPVSTLRLSGLYLRPERSGVGLRPSVDLLPCIPVERGFVTPYHPGGRKTAPDGTRIFPRRGKAGPPARRGSPPPTDPMPPPCGHPRLPSAKSAGTWGAEGSRRPREGWDGTDARRPRPGDGVKHPSPPCPTPPQGSDLPIVTPREAGTPPGGSPIHPRGGWAIRPHPPGG
jgi:hypothetical protein